MATKEKIMELFDSFRKKEKKQAEYHPLNTQDDPSLKRFHQIPDISSVIKKELSTLYMQSLTSLQDVSIYTITENYAISLLKSYYAKAMIVPMCIVDEVIKQVYNASNAALGQPVCESANLFKLRVQNKINGTNTKQKDIAIDMVIASIIINRIMLPIFNSLGIRHMINLLSLVAIPVLATILLCSIF